MMSEVRLDSTGRWNASENLGILRGRLRQAVKREAYEDAAQVDSAISKMRERTGR